MNKMLKDMFYQADGTLDLSRVLMAVLVLAFITQSTWAIWHNHQPIDWQGFGIGGGALLGGSGAGVMWHGRAS